MFRVGKNPCCGLCGSPGLSGDDEAEEDVMSGEFGEAKDIMAVRAEVDVVDPGRDDFRFPVSLVVVWSLEQGYEFWKDENCAPNFWKTVGFWGVGSGGFGVCIDSIRIPRMLSDPCAESLPQSQSRTAAVSSIVSAKWTAKSGEGRRIPADVHSSVKISLPSTPIIRRRVRPRRHEGVENGRPAPFAPTSIARVARIVCRNCFAWFPNSSGSSPWSSSATEHCLRIRWPAGPGSPSTKPPLTVVA